jgi:chitinase
MSADKIPSGYTHIHFAFGGISSSYAVDMSAVQDQFEIFAQRTSYKRILSFGGWSFSTDTDTYPIFRGGVTAENRLAFANSIVSVIEQYDLDGVDYLAFLQTMRCVLPSGKTMSIAAPASYWYLRNFPIAQMSEVLDYIVFMTYDLHGQWDYDNPNSQDGCPNGDCLRSHVNITETVNALSMITKAGVASNKIIVGVASYGRSFGMVDPSCTGPTCHYTGPNSTAFPGPCTNTAGYMAQAEILLFKSLQSPTWHDDPSNSDITVLPDGTWISYMSNDTMTYRRDLYYYANFGGTVEWAIDLAAFVEDTATATVTNSATLPTEVVTITFVEPSKVFFVTFTAEESDTATNELRQNFIDYVKQKHLE